MRKKWATYNGVGKHYLKVLAASQALKRLMSHLPRPCADLYVN